MKRNNEFIREQGWYMKGFGWKKWKGEIMSYYNVNIKLK